jgi:hypothetical protein
MFLFTGVKNVLAVDEMNYVLLLLKELEDVCSQSSLPVFLFELAAPD